MAKATAPKITTSPDRFIVCLPFTLAQEDVDPTNWSDPKNFSDDPHDPGGATMGGITQDEYDAWRKLLGLPTQDVKLITQAEGYAIYHANYWLPECPGLSAGLDLQFFDSAVNQGQEEATRILQVALGVESDGIFGPTTAAAVEAIKNVPAIVTAFTARREAVYKETANYQYFGTDWERRASEIGAEALTMASASGAATS
jgi:lysozyme family protein